MNEWRKRPRVRGKTLTTKTDKYSEPFLTAARDIAHQEGTSFSLLVERLMLGDDNEAKSLRKQLRNRVHALGGNNNNASETD